MKIVNLVLTVMFLIFSFVQVNDPDPLLWIFFYGSMAIVCVLAAFKIYSRIALLILLLAFVGYSFILIPGVSEWLAQDDRSALLDNVAKMQHLYIEEAREFLGLLICVIVVIMQLVMALRAKTHV